MIRFLFYNTLSLFTAFIDRTKHTSCNSNTRQPYVLFLLALWLGSGIFLSFRCLLLSVSGLLWRQNTLFFSELILDLASWSGLSLFYFLQVLHTTLEVQLQQAFSGLQDSSQYSDRC